MNASSLPLTQSRNPLSLPMAALLAAATLGVGAIAISDPGEVASSPANATVTEAPAAAAPQAADSRPAGPRGLASTLANRP